ncbi:hypothetical protein JAAARDRAFT_41753, partial [Jaapia argillacea MUCL 33604]
MKMEDILGTKKGIEALTDFLQASGALRRPDCREGRYWPRYTMQEARRKKARKATERERERRRRRRKGRVRAQMRVVIGRRS